MMMMTMIWHCDRSRNSLDRWFFFVYVIYPI